jgi:hypothetical protein
MPKSICPYTGIMFDAASKENAKARSWLDEHPRQEQPRA